MAARIFRLTDVHPLAVALVVLAVYGAGAAAIALYGDPAREAVIGRQFLDQGRGASPAIDALRGFEDSRLGYDGQFAAYIAIDPVHARPYLDTPAYRYSRILYPISARAAALGRAGAVPWALILVNVASAVLLTLATATLLARRGCSAWYALLAGLTPGLAMATLYDLNEPLGYALAAVGAFLLIGQTTSHRLVLAGIAFGLAGLARETTLVFPLAASLSLALGIADFGSVRRERQLRPAFILLALAVAPAVLIRLVTALVVDGSVAPRGARPELIPFEGLASSISSGMGLTQLFLVVVPAVLGLVVVGLAVRHATQWLIALAANVVFLVVLLPTGSYDSYLSSSRVTLGVPLALVLCLPSVGVKRDRLLVALIPAIWWMPGWVTVTSHFTLAVPGH